MVTSSAGTLNRPRTRHTSVRKDLCIFSPSATCRQTNKKYKLIRNNWTNFRTWWVHWRKAKWLMKTWGTLSPTTGSPRLTTREILPPSWKKKNLFTHFNSDRYLTGNQLNSESSVDAYINTLKQGCRCVECENLSFHLSRIKLTLTYPQWTVGTATMASQWFTTATQLSPRYCSRMWSKRAKTMPSQSKRPM